jgi:hypothetical protein
MKVPPAAVWRSFHSSGMNLEEFSLPWNEFGGAFTPLE